jgi:acyl-coenzyme A thioesterase PaaI-like protein
LSGVEAGAGTADYAGEGGAMEREAALLRDGWVVGGSNSPFLDLVGPVWRRIEGDKLRFGIFVSEKHDNSQRRAHGGVIMTFCDEGMGVTANAARPGEILFTVSFDCQFTSGATEGEFVEVLCEVVRATRSLMFMRSTCMIGDRVVAICSGVWKVLDRPRQIRRKATE